MARLTLADLESVSCRVEEKRGERECEWRTPTQPDESYDATPGPSGYFEISAYPSLGRNCLNTSY